MALNRNEPGITITNYTPGQPLPANVTDYGFEIWNSVADLRRRYFQNARTFLVKLQWDGTVLQEKWRKDISQKIVRPLGYVIYGDILIPNPEGISAYFKIFQTLPCGRYILVLRIRAVQYVNNNNNYYHNWLCLEAYLNGDIEPTDVQHRIFLPALPAPEPLNLQQLAPPSGHSRMQVGQYEDGREWAYIVSGNTKRWLVEFHTDINTSPTVYSNADLSQKVGPNINNVQGMANANNLSYWTDDRDGLIGKIPQ
jgi:hypothetical protein